MAMIFLPDKFWCVEEHFPGNACPWQCIRAYCKTAGEADAFMRWSAKEHRQPLDKYRIVLVETTVKICEKSDSTAATDNQCALASKPDGTEIEDVSEAEKGSVPFAVRPARKRKPKEQVKSLPSLFEESP